MLAARVTTTTELAALADDWQRLAAGAPLRGPGWLLAWWRNYGCDPGTMAPPRQLASIAIFDATGELVALAPWFVESSRLYGRVVRFLGSGEACTDYVGIPCQPRRAVEVARLLADELIGARSRVVAPDVGSGHRWWDVLDFSAVDRACPTMRALAAELENRGTIVRRGQGLQGWRISLPNTWEDYVARLSKSHRKQVRRLTRRVFDSGRLVVREARHVDDLPAALEVLASLHRKRRQSLGHCDAFAAQRFAAFHRQAAQALIEAGQLRLCWLELDGAALAAEYQLCGDGVVYAYQSGIDSARLKAEPGRLATIATIRAAIERGDRAFDFMRGDEPYKAHWRARPNPMMSLRVWPGSTGDWVRQGLWRAGQGVRKLVKDCRQIAGA